MECAVVCAAGAGALDGVAAVALMALGFAVAAALAVAVVSVVSGYAWVLTLAVAAAIPPALWLLVRVLKYGPTLEVFRRHRVPNRRIVSSYLAVNQAAISSRQTALPVRSSLMLEAPKVIPGEVLTGSVREKIKA